MCSEQVSAELTVSDHRMRTLTSYACFFNLRAFPSAHFSDAEAEGIALRQQNTMHMRYTSKLRPSQQIARLRSWKGERVVALLFTKPRSCCSFCFE